MRTLAASLTIAFAALLFTSTANAQTQTQPSCFELSRDGRSFSRTPERLCISQDGASNHYTIRLQTGITPVDVAVFHLDLTERVRCADCNRDVYSIANPSNSVLNELAIRFNGTRVLNTGAESGTVRVGATTFHYRRVASAPATQPPPPSPAAS